MKIKVAIASDMVADVTVIAAGDVITAIVGRASVSVSSAISPEKLIARRDRARADASSTEMDECDGHRTAVRSIASKLEEAQMVALLRFFGVTADAPDAYALACALDYAQRVAVAHALPAARSQAEGILSALPAATRDEVFGLGARASRLYATAWVSPAWKASQADAAAAKAIVEQQRIAALPEDTSWGYAHGGQD